MSQSFHFSYLLINLLVFLGPALASFDSSLQFRRDWLTAGLAISLTALPFIAWDAWFTSQQIWGFNHHFTLQPVFFGLPPGELLFFITVPFACLFLYRICVHFNWSLTLPAPVSPLVAALLAILATYNIERSYTVAVCCLCGLLFAILRNKRFFPYLLATYLLHVPAFLLVNGILTGVPLVVYNDTENWGLRFFSIPLEDFLYSFALLALNVWLFEALNRTATPD